MQNQNHHHPHTLLSLLGPAHQTILQAHHHLVGHHQSIKAHHYSTPHLRRRRRHVELVGHHLSTKGHNLQFGVLRSPQCRTPSCKRPWTMLVRQEQTASRFSPMDPATSPIHCWPMLPTHSTATSRTKSAREGLVILQGLPCLSRTTQVLMDAFSSTTKEGERQFQI